MSVRDVEMPKPLSRPIWFWALAIIAISHLYLVASSHDSLRLNVGDPWSEANVLSSLPYVKQHGFLETSFTDILDVGPLTEESYRYTHYPPLSEILYGALHAYAGVDSLGTMRLCAIGFSALAMWLLFCYVRRMWDGGVALLATMLWSANLLWMHYADMIHQAPVMQASAFLALWGLVRALEEPRRRYWIAAWVGSFACFLTSYDYFLFLPIAVIVTVGMRRGSLLRIRNWVPILWCGLGCFLALVTKCAFVIGAVGWEEFLADLHFQFLERSTATFEDHSNAVIPTITRRATMVFSPLIWGLLAYLGMRLFRRRTRGQFWSDGTWLLLPALGFFVVFSQLAASQMLTMQTALPFYAIASAVVLARLLRGSAPARRLATIVLIFAPLWSGVWLLRQDRSYLDEEGFRQVRTYLDGHDKNDWVMCNLMADGPIQAYLGRHYWPAFSSEYLAQYRSAALDLMVRFAHDEFYVLFFHDPRTRMIDKSLWPIAMPKKQWSVTGAPLFWPKKAAKLIRAYDALILDNLRDVGAEKVLSRPQFDLYRITRANVERAARAGVPDTSFVDFGSFTSERHKILGWSGQRWMAGETLSASSISGHAICPWWGTQWCRTVLTKRGLITRGDIPTMQGELMLHGSNACDGELVVRLVRSTWISIAINGKPFSATSPDLRTYRVHVPRTLLVDGVNEVALSYVGANTDLEAKVRNVPPHVASVELRQGCR